MICNFATLVFLTLTIIVYRFWKFITELIDFDLATNKGFLNPVNMCFYFSKLHLYIYQMFYV